MVNFFKSFGRGILYVLVLPIFLVVLALYAVVSLGIFFFMCIKWLILFFTGRSLFDDLPEDKQAKAILNANAPKQENVTTDLNDFSRNEDIAFKPGPVIPEEDYNPTEEDKDPFYVPEYLKQHVEEKQIEEVEQESLQEETYQEEEIEEEDRFEYSSDFDDMRRQPKEEDDLPEESGVNFSDGLDEEDKYNGY